MTPVAPSRFSEKDVSQLVALSHLNPKAIQRLLGSIRVPQFDPGAGTERRLSAGFYELGFRFDNIEVLTQFCLHLGKDKMLEKIAESLIQLAQQCPLVVQWLGRGDFAVDNVPPEINRAQLQFACRSVGRLRALALREAQP